MRTDWSNDVVWWIRQLTEAVVRNDGVLEEGRTIRDIWEAESELTALFEELAAQWPINVEISDEM